MLAISNEAQFNAGLDRWLADTEDFLTRVFRGYSVRIFGMVVAETPQWEGTAAANWRYAINAPDTSYDAAFVVPGAVEPVSDAKGTRMASRLMKGSEAAMSEAAALAADPKQLTLKDTVYITNSLIKASTADGDLPEYVEAIELGELDLRPINAPGEMISRTVSAYFGGFDVIDEGLAVTWAHSTMNPYQFQEYVLS